MAPALAEGGGFDLLPEEGLKLKPPKGDESAGAEVSLVMLPPAARGAKEDVVGDAKWSCSSSSSRRAMLFGLIVVMPLLLPEPEPGPVLVFAPKGLLPGKLCSAMPEPEPDECCCDRKYSAR